MFHFFVHLDKVEGQISSIISFILFYPDKEDGIGDAKTGQGSLIWKFRTCHVRGWQALTNQVRLTERFVRDDKLKSQPNLIKKVKQGIVNQPLHRIQNEDTNRVYKFIVCYCNMC